MLIGINYLSAQFTPLVDAREAGSCDKCADFTFYLAVDFINSLFVCLSRWKVNVPCLRCNKPFKKH